MKELLDEVEEYTRGCRLLTTPTDDGKSLESILTQVEQISLKLLASKIGN